MSAATKGCVHKGFYVVIAKMKLYQQGITNGSNAIASSMTAAAKPAAG
jgi:hypothetical protein